MSFFRFMIKNYFDTIGPKGHLAEDMIYDINKFPQYDFDNIAEEYHAIEDYMHREGACYDCMFVFYECWSEYVDARCS